MKSITRAALDLYATYYRRRGVAPEALFVSKDRAAALEAEFYLYPGKPSVLPPGARGILSGMFIMMVPGERVIAVGRRPVFRCPPVPWLRN